MLYRAYVKPQGDRIMPLGSLRAPGNVPYLVDNIWEWLRPAGAPNRRMAAFASPRPELAISTLKKSDQPPFVYEVDLPEGWTIAQIAQGENPTDARYHSDVRDLARLVLKLLGPDWLTTGHADRGVERDLFQPALAKQDVEQILTASDLLDKAALRAASRFWDDVRIGRADDPLHESGEIFFEVPPQGYGLTLVAV